MRLIHTDISYILAGFTSVSLSGTCNFPSIFNKRAGGLFYQSHTHLLYLHTHKVHTHGPERSDKSDDGFDRSAALALQLSPGLHTHTYTHNSRWNCLYIKHPRHKPPPTHTYTHTYTLTHIYIWPCHPPTLSLYLLKPSSSWLNEQQLYKQTGPWHKAKLYSSLGSRECAHVYVCTLMGVRLWVYVIDLAASLSPCLTATWH